jgi:hypothetical protein
VKTLIAGPPPAPPVLPPKKDWCGSNGSEAVPEGALGVDWSDACKTHDECYATPGASKLTCDYNLQQDMSLACAAQGAGVLCQVIAEVYRHGVHLFGGTAFANAQRSAQAEQP